MFACQPLSTIPQIHNFAPSAPSIHFQQKLVVASRFQVAIAVSSSHELVSFRSSAVHEVSSAAFGSANKTQTKVTTLDSQWEIVTIGLNADDTLLGVFANNQYGCFVHIYNAAALSVDVPGEAVPLCSVRVGNTASKGIAFEWNPALSEMFAASDTERTLSVAKVDIQNPSKYSILGEKKLEANLSEISWSPKGKQLVVGDANGKIFQLKPEIELVRVTNAPQNAHGLIVTSLSWLATTEWLVAYSNAERSSGGTFMLNIKKDKPPSWTPIDLSGQFFFGESRQLLVDWHIVVVALPGTGHILGICKPPNANAWTTVPLASLPQPSPASYMSGVAVDLSRQALVPIGDGSTRRVPVLVALNSDGSLRSFQLSPPTKDFPDCNVSLASVDVKSIQLGIRPADFQPVTTATIQSSPLQSSTAAAPLSQSTPLSGLFAKMGESKSQVQTPAFATSTPATGLFGASKITAQSPLSLGTPTTGSILSSAQFSGTATSSTPSNFQTTPKSVLAQPQTDISSMFGKPAIVTNLSQETVSSQLARPSPISAATQEKVGPDPAELAKASEAALASARTSAVETVEKFHKAWVDSHRNLHSYSINMKNVKESIDDAVASLTHVENCEAADEIQRMVIELDEELNDMLRLVTEKKEVIEEKTATYKESRGAELNYRRPLDLLERTHSDSVMQKFDEFTSKLHETKKMIAEIKKLAGTNKPRRATEFDPKFEVRLHESMKNLGRYFTIIRARVDDIERKALHLTTQKRVATADQSLTNSMFNSSLYDEVPSSIFVTSTFKPVPIQNGISKSQQRSKLLEIMNATKNTKVVTKKVEPLRIECCASDDTLSSSFSNAPNLETSLHQKIASPLKVKSVLTMRNASTQADSPSVEAPSPAPKLLQTPPISSGLSSLSASNPAASILGSLPKASNENKLASGIVPLATSTPGSKLGETSLNPSGSLFSSLSSVVSAASSQPAVSKHVTEGNLLGGKTIFENSLTAVKSSSTSTGESKTLGGLGTTTSASDMKEDKKPSSLFGNLGAAAAAGAKEKDGKTTSLFRDPAATTITSANAEKPATTESKATSSEENKESKPTSLFGGTAQQTNPKSNFGGGDAITKPLSFTAAAQPAKSSEVAVEKDEKSEASITKSTEKKQSEVKPAADSLGTSSAAPATLITTTATSTTSSIFGRSTTISSAPTTATTTTASSSIFGAASTVSSAPASTSTTTTTPSSSIFGSSITAPATTATTSSIFGAPKTSSSQSTAFGSIFGAKDAGPAQGIASNQVTFSFKPKAEPEVAPQVTASFTFTPKPSTGSSLGFAAAAAAAASSVDDEGMDDDGATSGSAQGNSSIFGGGFMSGIGSTAGSNANKNVFGMGTSNLLKNAGTQPATSSLFKTGQSSIFGSNAQTSSFATAAQQVASSNVSPSSSISKSVFGSSPKFGGPPVFGGKPVFGSPTQPSAFGGTVATTGGFSSFSGNKSLFGGASSGGSSLFGGGTSNQNQPKSSLFGGGQPSSSFSTWR